MATVNLGRIKPVFRGAFNNSTAYVIDDIVTSGNETFIAIAATQGNATTDASKWTKLAAKGADGTDVAATLANKEIAFKTNAGALDGIPIGSAGEFLKVNSGATGYEYGAVSSDYVKIAAAGSGTDVSLVTITTDKSLYRTFDLFIHAVPTSDGGHPRIRLRNASGDLNVNNYMSSYMQVQGGGGSISTNHENGNAEFRIGGNGGYTDLEGHSFHITWTPYDTRYDQAGGSYNSNLMTWSGFRIDESTAFRSIQGAGTYKSIDNSITSFDFFYNTGNVSMYNYNLYGRKV